MWQAITAALGLANTANQGAQRDYTQQRADYDASIDFVRAKDMSYYASYAGQGKTMIVAVIAGFVLIVAMAWLGSKR